MKISTLRCCVAGVVAVADETAAKLAAATSAKESVDKKPAESDEAKAKALADEKKAAEDTLKQATEKNDRVSTH